MRAVLLTLDDRLKPAKKTKQKQLSVTSMSAATVSTSQESYLERSKCTELSGILTLQTVRVPTGSWAEFASHTKECFK